MDIWVIILLVVVILHFLAGFGFLIYKFSSPKKEKKEDKSTNTSIE